MGFFAISPREGYCLLDFYYIWLLQAIRDRDADLAYQYAKTFAGHMRRFYPDLREGA